MAKLHENVAESAPAPAGAGRECAPVPPALQEIAPRLKHVCERRGIFKLEVFGSVARGEQRPGSDVDLIASFRRVPGLDFPDIEQEMEQVLGVKVDLLTRELADELLTNPFIRLGMVRDQITIYGA